MNFVKALLYFIEELSGDSRLLARVSDVGELCILIGVEHLDFFKDLERIVLNRLREGLKNDLFVNHLRYEVEVLLNTLLLLLYELFLLLVFLYYFLVLFF